MLHFAQRATVLPRDAHGVRTLFDKARLVEHQDPIGLAHLRGDKLMLGPPHGLLIPGDLTEQPLQPTDAPSGDPEGHGLDRLACQRTPLAHHIIKETGARLTPRKTVVKEALELLEFVGEPSHIPGVSSKGGIANSSPAVRHAGNIRPLLFRCRVYRKSVSRGYC